MAEVRMKRHFANIFMDDDFDILLMIGGYGSGKSYTGFLKAVTKATKEKRKIMVVRKVYDTIKDSCFEDVKAAVDTINKNDIWKFKVSPYEAINKKKGSSIIFKGMNDFGRIKSIKDIDYIIVEEAAELTMEDLKELRKRLRVQGIKKHIVLMCNPISRMSAIYKMFFTEEGENFSEYELYEKRILTKKSKIKLNDGTVEEVTIKIHHSTYKDNPFLPAIFIYELEHEKDPRIRRIAKDGKFGTDGDLVFYNAVFEENVYERYVQNKLTKKDLYRGVDWGFSNSYTAGYKVAVNRSLNELYIYWEFYEKGMKTWELIEALKPLMEDNILIFGDSEAPQTIADFYDAGYNIDSSKKGQGSVAYYEELLRSFSRIVIDKARCPNCKKEFENAVYKKNKHGEAVPGLYNIDPHSVDAIKYSLSDYEFVSLKNRLKKKYIGV